LSPEVVSANLSGVQRCGTECTSADCRAGGARVRQRDDE